MREPVEERPERHYATHVWWYPGTPLLAPMWVVDHVCLTCRQIIPSDLLRAHTGADCDSLATSLNHTPPEAVQPF